MMGPRGRCAVALSKHEAGRGHFTYQDLLHTPDDGKRYEVLEGDLVVSPAPRTKHQRIVMRLIRLLIAAEDAEHGLALGAPCDVVFSEHDVVEPDLLFVAKARKDIIAVENVQGAPDLAVEVISEGSRKRDVITKRGIYERYGVRFYWLVDPEEETVRVFELKDGAYGEPATLKAGQQLGCALFPGITQDVGQLFAAP
jgi:Uma2 family endonuclease